MAGSRNPTFLLKTTVFSVKSSVFSGVWLRYFKYGFKRLRHNSKVSKVSPKCAPGLALQVGVFPAGIKKEQICKYDRRHPGPKPFDALRP